MRPDETALAEHRLGLAADPLAQVAGPADHRTLDPRAGAQVALSAITERRISAPSAIRTFEPRTVYSPRTTPAPTEQLSPMTAGPSTTALGSTVGALAQPDARPQREPVDLDLDRAVEDVLVGLEVGLDGAHVLPVALGDVAVDGAARPRGPPGRPRSEKSTGRPSGMKSKISGSRT